MLMYEYRCTDEDCRMRDEQVFIDERISGDDQRCGECDCTCDYIGTVEVTIVGRPT